MLLAERVINVVTKPIGLRVIMSPQSGLHSEEISFRADGLITSHTANFLEDQRFLDVIESVRRDCTHPVYNVYRIYVAICLADLARRIPGTIFVECGVGEGMTSLAINRYLKGSVPRSYLIDTFAGIDAKQLQDNELRNGSAEDKSKDALKSYSTSDIESVQHRFRDFPHITLIKGSVPDVLNEHEFKAPVSWLHIDMNNAYPEACALKFFYDLLSVPGFILFDDYAFKGLRPQKDAIDAVCAKLGISKPMSLPTGQGLIIKTVTRQQFDP